MEAAAAIRAVQEAGRSRGTVVLEGFHPLKHALRFGADVSLVITRDNVVAADLPPGCPEPVAVSAEEFATAVRHAPSVAIAALARRPDAEHTVRAVLAATTLAPVVLLERPVHLGNLGAVVRVAAAAGAAAVVTTGTADPWHAAALRGGAGLQFAVPTASADLTDILATSSARPLLAFDPDGDPLPPADWPAGAILAFGTERAGLSEGLLARADQRIRLPMRGGVSSLNLATSVAAVLYRSTGAPWSASEGRADRPYDG